MNVQEIALIISLILNFIQAFSGEITKYRLKKDKQKLDHSDRLKMLETCINIFTTTEDFNEAKRLVHNILNSDKEVSNGKTKPSVQE